MSEFKELWDDITYYDTTQKRVRTKLQVDDNNKRSGKYEEFYPSGQLFISANYKEDLLDGEYLLYDKNGLLLIKHTYQKGLLRGPCEEWYLTGGKKSQYIQGEKGPVGKQCIWTRDGYLVGENNWDDESKYHGECKNFMPTGKPWEFTTYVHGEKNGPFKKYNFDGLIMQGFYAKDRLNGVILHFDKDGHITQQDNYVDGFLEGLQIKYDKGMPHFARMHIKNQALHTEYLSGS